MDERRFWAYVVGRLEAMERSQSWLARHVGISRMRMHLYLRGHRMAPAEIKERVAAVLDIRLTEQDQEAAA